MVHGLVVGGTSGGRVPRHTVGRGRGARTDRRVPRPGHRLAHDDRVPSGRRRRRQTGTPGQRRPAAQASRFLLAQLHQQRRTEQLEDGRGRRVRRVRPADRHRGRAPRLQRRGRVAHQALVPLGVRPAVPAPVHRVHVLLRLRQLLFQLGVHSFFQGS